MNSGRNVDRAARGSVNSSSGSPFPPTDVATLSMERTGWGVEVAPAVGVPLKNRRTFCLLHRHDLGFLGRVSLLKSRFVGRARAATGKRQRQKRRRHQAFQL